MLQPKKAVEQLWLSACCTCLQSAFAALWLGRLFLSFLVISQRVFICKVSESSCLFRNFPSSPSFLVNLSLSFGLYLLLRPLLFHWLICLFAGLFILSITLFIFDHHVLNSMYFKHFQVFLFACVRQGLFSLFLSFS